MQSQPCLPTALPQRRSASHACRRYGGLGALVLILAVLAGCTVNPTPYAPRDADGYGYDAVRLQERVWRVSFRANAYTSETRVLDYLYLRAAELTLESGYTHFLVQQDFGRTAMSYRAADPFMGGGYSAFDRPFWGGGFGYPPASYEAYVDYHVAVLIIRMLTEKEAADREQAYAAQFIVDSLGPQARRPAP